ncbi:hypothetical protein U27_03710 [Candidatus Vecturithrix granuli]|uniref:Uncharacterized protein n=1 Tax=Vecturithrix granuli TaxID=1499967 RepID=A0A081BWP1_VECG1|nr:hypothetical protein U27_03710 [Candidatus Vecturithrix granuli]
MIVLLANGQTEIECNICHAQFLPEEDHDHVEITPQIHICSGCRTYQTQPISFFAWYLQLERLYQQRGQAEVPRSGRYSEDWPIYYYQQGLTPEAAIQQIEAEG